MILQLRNELGDKKARSFLKKYYAKRENIDQFKGLFTEHLTIESPEFHNELLSAFTKTGKIVRAAPRGFAKSTIASIVTAAWYAIYSKRHFILIVSDTATQAEMHLQSLKSTLESNRLIRWLYGDLVGYEWGKQSIVVDGIDGETMVRPLGAGQKVRGLKFKNYRPDLAIVDDLENDEAVRSRDRRRKLENWFNYSMTPAMAKPKHIICLGTILHYNSLLRKMVNKKDKYKGWDSKLYRAITDGESIWPEAYSTDYLRAIRDDSSHPDYMGSRVFAQEMQNEPQDDKDRVIQLEWLKDYHFEEKTKMEFEGDHFKEKRQKFLDSLERFAAVDPAISEKDTADFFSFYIAGFEGKSGNEYMLDLIHGHYSVDEQVEKIVDGVRAWDVQTLGIESNAYQAGLYQLVKKKLQQEGLSCKIKKIITDKDKVRRAKINSAAFEGGFIYFRRDHRNSDILKREIEEFPLGEHDDAFDSLMLARETRTMKTKPRAFKHKLSGF